MPLRAGRIRAHYRADRRSTESQSELEEKLRVPPSLEAVRERNKNLELSRKWDDTRAVAPNDEVNNGRSMLDECGRGKCAQRLRHAEAERTDAPEGGATAAYILGNLYMQRRSLAYTNAGSRGRRA